MELAVSSSYASGSLTDLHFGLGRADVVDRLEILWPGGQNQVFEGVVARRIYQVRPGEALRQRELRSAAVPPH